MALIPVAMHHKVDTSWGYMPEFLRRIDEFGRHEDWTSRAKERFQAAFAGGRNEMLGLILVEQDGTPRGHMIAGIETMLGDPFVVVYQLAKDAGHDKGWARTTQRCQDMVDAWAMTLGITKCTVSVIDEARVRLFLRHGYSLGPRLLHRNVIKDLNTVVQEPEKAEGAN